MMTRDMRRLLGKLDARLTQVLEAAVGFCVARGHYEVALEHLLAKLLEHGGDDVGHILRHFAVDEARLRAGVLRRLEEFRTGNAGRPVLSPAVLGLLERAWVAASVQHGFPEVRSGNLLEAVLAADALRLERYLEPLGAVREDELRERYAAIVAGSAEAPPAAPAAPLDADGGDAGGRGALARYTLDLTGRARAGAVDPVFGRDAEIRQVIDILSRRRKNNPVLVGEAGVGKTAVVEGLALRVAQGDVPESLAAVEIRTLDLGLLQAGAGVKGEFENRLKSVIREVREAPRPVILFVDEAHTLIGAGGAAGTSDAANLLKPALARGELRTIAATTWSEYKRYFERDAALERRFQQVKILEPTVETATTMLRGITPLYERHHGVHISDRAVASAVRLAARFISGRQLPDKAVDLLDTAAARVRMTQTATPSALDEAERRLRDLDVRLEALGRDAAAGVPGADDTDALRAERAGLAARREELAARWARERDAAARVLALRQPADGGRPSPPEALRRARAELAELQGDRPMVHAEVDAAVAAQVVADWTGIPAGAMLKDDVARLIELEERLRERVRGQPEAVGELADALRTGRAGIGNPEAPLGVFLLVGPSGVGKTECARAIADLLFGGDRFLVTVNMTEYRERHTASQLKGSPPGYVGYGEGGVLTEAVRQHPYAVVLLDEVEKAHRDVLNLFYQVFDKGVMRDGEGREIDFRNTVIIMTSNVGADDFLEACRAGGARPDPDELRALGRERLQREIAPALLARARVVPFYPLGADVMREVVRLKLDRVGGRVAQAHRLAFRYDDAVVDWIAARCTETETGARNADAILDRALLPAVSRALLLRAADGPPAEALTVGVAADGTFTYAFGAPEPPADPEPLAVVAPADALPAAATSVPAVPAGAA